MNEAYINIMEQEKQLQLHITKNDRKIITDFANSLSDKEYQLRCMWAIQILESKLTMINLELQENLQREVVVRLTHRIKSAESIFLKLRRKGYTINLDNAKKKLNDIVGVRVTCIFRDDIYALVDCLKIQHDIKILKIKDYIKTPKSSGYQGDKVEAQLKFGWEVDAYPVNEIADAVAAVSESDTNALVDEYYDKYDILLEGRDPAEFRKHVAVQAQIEIGFERFLKEKNYQAIVTHFGDLGALKQLPGLAIQRLMEKGYGFGAEGDWKVAAMVRLMKVMTAGMKDAKGTSMLEDYTYNLVPGKEGILEAHMLEICPSISEGPIQIKCQPLSMGDREDPARLVFTSKNGHGIATSLIDLGNRFRLIINDVECKQTEKPMPKLPTATNFWTPEPDLYTGAEAWILAGGAHHTAFTYDLTAEQMCDWAAMMGIEAVVINKDTNIRDFKRDLMLGDIVYR